MSLNMKQIQEAMGKVMRSHRERGETYTNLLKIKISFDKLADELRRKEMTEGKKKKQDNGHIDNQIKMIKAFRMNNPLWDV